MADAPRTASGLELVTLVFNSCVELHAVVCRLDRKDKNSRDLRNKLKGALGELASALHSYLKTLVTISDLEFGSLNSVLQRCRKTCQGYANLLSPVIAHSVELPYRSRDWTTEKYLCGDVLNLVETLAGYTSIIRASIDGHNLRLCIVTAEELEALKNGTSKATYELKEQHKNIITQVNYLDSEDIERGDYLAMVEERQSIEHGLGICSRVSVQAAQFEPAPNELSPSIRPALVLSSSDHRLTMEPLVQSFVSILRGYKANITKRLEVLAAETAQLQETDARIQECINTFDANCSPRARDSGILVEDVAMTGGIRITRFPLIQARGFSLTGQSRNVMGQMSDESLQRTIEAFTRQDRTKQNNTGSGFDGRFGPGVRLGNGS